MRRKEGIPILTVLILSFIILVGGLIFTMSTLLKEQEAEAPEDTENSHYISKSCFYNPYEFYNEYGTSTFKIENVEGQDRIYFSDCSGDFEILGWKVSLYADGERKEEKYYSYDSQNVYIVNVAEIDKKEYYLRYIPLHEIFTQLEDKDLIDKNNEIHLDPIVVKRKSSENESTMLIFNTKEDIENSAEWSETEKNELEKLYDRTISLKSSKEIL